MKKRGMMKKILGAALCVMLIFSMSACGTSGAGSSSGSASPGSTSSQVSSDSSSKAVLKVYDKSGNEVKAYTKKEFSALKTVTRTYSGRNKKDKNKRQIVKYKGVDLKVFMKDAGIADAKDIMVTCDDDYTNEYNVSDLYDLYAFKTEKGSSKSKVSPMITIKERRLVMGQADYDADDTKDFNMQNWARGICKVEVKD